MMLGAPGGVLLPVPLKRLVIAIGIILAGVAAAMPFRQSPPPSRPPHKPAITPLALTLRKPDAPIELAPRIEVSPATELAEKPNSEQGSGVRSQESGPTSNLAPPPALPVSFQPSTSAPTASDWRPESLLTAPRQPSPPRPYRLRDGDTLEKIADRLLGDATRAAEIFEANRNLLARPDLLPVGVVIMLPPRATTDSADLLPTISNRLTAPNN